ncbi:MAG: Hcp family type VI secretion system effector [Lautropia sp.]
MAGDCFLSLNLVSGEASDPGFAGAIEVDSWNWGALSRGEQGAALKRTGAADIRLFEFTHAIDTASPALLSRCVTGILIPHGTLTQRRAGGTAQKFVEIRFTQIRIVECTLGMNTVDGFLRTHEKVSFAFETATFDYTPQAKTGGDKSGKHSFQWIGKGAL